MSYLIKPTNMVTGAEAPAILSYCEKTDDAVQDARSRSNLSRYDNWSFNINVVHIRDKDKLSSYEKKRNESN